MLDSAPREGAGSFPDWSLAEAEIQSSRFVAGIWGEASGLAADLLERAARRLGAPLDRDSASPEFLALIRRTHIPPARYFDSAREIVSAASRYRADNSPIAHPRLERAALTTVADVLEQAQLRARRTDPAEQAKRRRLMRSWRIAIASAAGLYACASLWFGSWRPGLWFARTLPFAKIVFARQDWGHLRLDRSVTGGRLVVGGKDYATGIGTHANSTVKLEFDAPYRRLSGRCGPDIGATNKATVQCVVWAAGKELFRSKTLMNGHWADFDVDVAGLPSVELRVTDGGDGIHSDHADWVELAAR